MDEPEILNGRSKSTSSKKKTLFAHDVMKLALGTVFAQAISILISPILTRLYGPEAFGLSALFGGIAGIIGVVACLQYDAAIILPKDDEDAVNLLGLSFFFVTLVSITTVPVIWLIGPQILGLMKATELNPYIWLIPVAIFVNGALFALNYWNSRTKQFGRLSFARVNSTVATAGVQIGASSIGHATMVGLIFGSLSGSAVSALVLGGQIWRDDKMMLCRSLNFKDMVSGLRRYKNFPLYSTWTVLLNTLSWQVPTFLLSAYFSSTIVGYYYLSMMVFQLPMSLIASSISQVFLQHAAEAKHSGSLSTLVEGSILRLSKLAIFPSLVLLIIGREIFSVIFGAHWTEAGVYVQILAPWMFFAFMVSPMSTLFLVLEKQRMSFAINTLFFPMRIGALVLGGILMDARIAIVLFTVTGVIIHGATLIWLVGISGVPIYGFMASLARHFAYSMLFLSPVILADLFWHSHQFFIVSLACFMAALYYMVIIKNDDLLKNSILHIYKGIYSGLNAR